MLSRVPANVLDFKVAKMTTTIAIIGVNVVYVCFYCKVKIIIPHEIWSFDSQENHYICCHQMLDFAPPQTLLGELTALPKPPC